MLSELMELIKVELIPFEIKKGVTLYIRLPSLTDYTKCTDPYSTIYYCTTDESGNRLFESTEQVEHNVNLDIQLKLTQRVNEIFVQHFDQDKIEKK